MVAPDEGEGAEAPSSRLVRCICCGVTLVEIDVSRAAAHLLLAWQLLMLALFALWCEYDYALGAPMDLTYTWYVNLALFALVGLGLHLAFASRYALTAVGFTLLLTALSLQWGVLANGYFAALAARARVLGGARLGVSLATLLDAEVGALATLVSFGALVGRVSLLQATVLAIVETVVYSANQALVLADGALAVCDVGGTVGVHLFGAYFGLAVSLALGAAPAPPPPDADAAAAPPAAPPASRASELFALLGTLVMWVYWPALSARSLDDGSHQMARAVVNTVLALCSSTVVAFALSLEASESAAGPRLRPADVRNATLAGGVAVGAVANWAISPAGALGVGAAAGAAATLGSARVRDALRAAGVADACDVHSLHGLPALVGVAASAIAAALTKEPFFAHGAMQWAYQLYGAAATLGVALVGGLFTGGVLWLLATRAPESGDDAHWTGVPRAFKEV